MIAVTQWRLFSESVDMRKGIDSLLALVMSEGGDRKPQTAYIFCNRNGTRLKVLLWDGLGFWLCARRLEQGRFHLPRGDVAQYELSAESRSTLAGWVAACGIALQPLVDALRKHLLQQSILHADETPVAVLTPGKGQTHRAYLWAYRTSTASPQQAVVFDFQMSRAGQHAQTFLAGFKGALMVDDYGGYKALFESNDRIELACLAHIRRKFFDLHAANKSLIAHQALDYISRLYTIEAEAANGDHLQRQALRQSKAKPVLTTFYDWLIASRNQVPNSSSTAKAIDYALKRWTALLRYLDHGEYPIDNNAIENSIRPIALGRKNWLFAGTETAGRRAAAIMSLIQSAKLNGHDPFAYLKNILTRLPTHSNNRINELLPYHWKYNN